jgi:hypothetical protein
MTSTNSASEVIKQDSRGRVLIPAERREALLGEFERSGASAARFARLAGIKYSTFANWVQARRKRRLSGEVVVSVTGGVEKVAGPVRLFEALVEGVPAASPSAPSSAAGLLIELPGGSRVRIDSPGQLEMAAELVSLMAQRARARC